MVDAATRKTAIVTGSASGIGRAVALALADRGYNVVINCVRSEDKARATAAEVRERGGDAEVVCADVSEDRACRQLVDTALSRWNRLDVVVHSAGFTQVVPADQLDALTEEIWDRTFAVNAKGSFLLARAAAPALKQTRGSLTFISSTAGLDAVGSSIAYAASKAALNNLTVSLANALGPEVRVNAVAPGYVETEWNVRGHGARLDALRKTVAQMTPLRAVAGPEHVAQVVLALATAMDFVTGQVIVADGGRLRRI